MSTLHDQICNAIDLVRSGSYGPLDEFVGLFLKPFAGQLKPEDIAELRNDALLAVARKMEAAEPTPRIAVQLKSIVSNHAKTALRSKSRRPATTVLDPVADADNFIAADNVENVVEQRETLRNTVNVMKKLREDNPHYFDVIVQSYNGEQRKEEHTVSNAAFRKTLQRARAKARSLRESLYGDLS